MKLKKFIFRLWIIQVVLLGYSIYRLYDAGSILDKIVFRFDSKYEELILSRSDSLLELSLSALDLTITNPNQYKVATDYHHVQISDDIAVSYSIIKPYSMDTIMSISLDSYQLAHENFAYDHRFNKIDWSGSVFWQSLACNQFKEVLLSGVPYSQNHNDWMIVYNYFRYAFVYIALISSCLLPFTSAWALWLLFRPQSIEES
ncbi:MAG: hypothetical protein IJ724_11715 [Muribaculaceae bacterium]|nr:hypothetical protein [Muribaculaceae bacterium]